METGYIQRKEYQLQSRIGMSDLHFFIRNDIKNYPNVFFFLKYSKYSYPPPPLRKRPKMTKNGPFLAFRSITTKNDIFKKKNISGKVVQHVIDS